MVIRRLRLESRWSTALLAGLALLIGGLVPSPFERRPAFERIGPDKILHFVGHSGFAVATADALAADGHSIGRAVCLSISASTTLGAVVGALQRSVPGREPERADFVAGTVGSIAAVGYWVAHTADSQTARDERRPQ